MVGKILERERQISLDEGTDCQSKKYLVWMLGLIVVLNLYDMIHTFYLYSHSLAAEGNPLMGYLLEVSPDLALIFKMGMVLLFCLVMIVYAGTHCQRAMKITSLVASLYLLVAFWHITGRQILRWLS